MTITDNMLILEITKNAKHLAIMKKSLSKLLDDDICMESFGDTGESSLK